MTFKRVNDFSTDDPVMLDRELSQLEDNVSAQFDVAEKTYAKQMAPASFMPIGAASAVPMQPSTQLSLDTSQASALAVLPALDPTNFGKRFTIIKRLATNSVVVNCTDTTVTLNGAAFPLTLTAVGVTIFYCDAAGYWR
jgi:hypothetical protein